MSKRLPEKEVLCQCGHTVVMDRSQDWCEKCARRIHYSEKDRRRGKWNTLYFYTVMFFVILFLSYVFIELILDPVFKGGI